MLVTGERASPTPWIAATRPNLSRFPLLDLNPLYEHLASGRRKADLARPGIANIYRNNTNLPLRQITHGKIGILSAHITHAVHNPAGAKDLCFQVRTLRTKLQDMLDQQLHGRNAVAG
jgi:hypothetical protein